MEFTLYQLAWYFVIYSFLGWCLEVVFCTVNTGKWVNRGFLNGPVCPIYGFGMVIVLSILSPLSSHPFALFAGSFVLTSTLELVTGWVLKTMFHTTWWDYSREPFNIGGYVCLKFSLAWGLGGMAAVRVLHPPVDALVNWIPKPIGLCLLILFLLLFAVDFMVTLRTLIGLNRDLGELEHIAAVLHKGSDTISRNLGDAALAADEKLTEGKQAIPQKLAELEARRDFLMARIIDTKMFGASRFMKAFPHMNNLRYTTIFSELKEMLHQRLSK